MRTAAVCTLLLYLAGCQASQSASTAYRAHEALSAPDRYPPPTSKSQGRTAAEWGEIAKDTDPKVCYRACVALQSLGAEGTPFFLDAMEYHAKASRLRLVASNIALCRGQLIHPDDLPRIVRFLDPQYDKTEDIQDSALTVLRLAGPKAKPYVEPIRRLLSRPDCGLDAKAALKAIEGN